MALPRIDTPIFTMHLPSTGNAVKFRPFTVKEEKLLLMATESKDQKYVNDTIKQIITNCFITEVDIDELATFDVEYLFVQLRSKSVNNEIELKFKNEDGDVQAAVANLDDAKVVFDEKHNNKIKLSDNVTITMRYPSFSMIEKLSSTEDADLIDVISNSIDKVVNGEEVLDLSDYPKDEISGFVESFTSKNMRDIETFFKTLPYLKLDIEYTDMKSGEKKVHEVRGLQNFFT